MALATLSGHCIRAAAIGPVADHTYVLSSDGYAWGCWGRSRRRNAITRGLRYGRFLGSRLHFASELPSGNSLWPYGRVPPDGKSNFDPASVLVSRARGYQVSWLLYQTYGLPWHFPAQRPPDSEDWPQRKNRCALPASSSPLTSAAPSSPLTSTARAPAAQPTSPPPTQHDFSLITRLRQFYDSPASQGPNSTAQCIVQMRGETELVVSHRFGPNADDALTDMLVRIRVKMYSERVTWAVLALQGKIDGVAFADRVNDRLREMLRLIQSEIGAVSYQRLFDLKAGEYVGAVDSSIAGEWFRRASLST